MKIKGDRGLAKGYIELSDLIEARGGLVIRNDK